MNSIITKLFAVVLAVIVFALNACDKDEPECAKEPTDAKVEILVQGGIERTPIVIDGKKQEWTLPARNKSLSKGIIANEATLYPLMETLLGYKLIDTVNFVYHNTNYSMKVMRVDRKSEPGKYFYVMIENLKVKLDTACWAYADDESNANTYGRLYTWHAANALAPQITMQLPIYSESNPTEPLFENLTLPSQAKILSRKDVCDIIECDAIGNLPGNGYTITDNIGAPPHGTGPYPLPLYYYDVFIGGLEWSGYTDYTRGLHTLGGLRNTIQQDPMYWTAWVNGWYTYLSQEARIWLRDPSISPTSPFHYPLDITYKDDYNYSAYINAQHWDQYGFSVRYVFEPRYL